MVDLEYLAEDWNFPFLIKTMKKERLERTLKEGRFCFTTPSTFIGGDGLASAQQDRFEAHLSIKAYHLMVAPILYEDKDGPHYGPAEKFASQAQMHVITDDAKHTPLCSFRYVDPTELIEKYGAYFFRLGNTVDRIKDEFKHNAFIFILAPQVFGHRLFQKAPCFSYKVHYGDINLKFNKFIEQVGYQTASLFQKDPLYQWQQEFRIILEPKEKEGKHFIEIGSIEDIAFGGELEQLRNGFIICESSDHLKEVNQILAQEKLTIDDIFSAENKGEPSDKPNN